MNNLIRLLAAIVFLYCTSSSQSVSAQANGIAGPGRLQAGAGKIDITNERSGPIDGRMHVRALVLQNGNTTAVIITVDAVAIGEIGYIGNEYLDNVRMRIEQDFGIKAANVLVNASHCHGIVCDGKEIEDRTLQAVQIAKSKLVPVRIGAGIGQENRIMENRRLRLKSGREIDVRHAYSLPPDDEVAEVGPVDPEIGLLRLDALDGSNVAVVYNFACHPIQGVPSGANTADITGFSSEVIEDNLTDGAVALFVQGCAGDINPISYKAVDVPRSAETLGNLLGLSTLKAIRKIQPTEDDRLSVTSEVIQLPRSDLDQRIVAMKAERERLVGSLQGTYLNLRSFLPLTVKYKLSDQYPSANAYEYLREQQIGRKDLTQLDTVNRAHIKKYVNNIHTMEQITRINTNLRLLQKHQAQMIESGKRTIDAEIAALRVGDFVLTTFPGELTVQIGINIKQRSPHDLTFVAGYTNGYLYYAPTAKQLSNVGGAQEDSDCLLAPDWQKQYETKVAQLLSKL
jgi:hypothetical protein